MSATPASSTAKLQNKPFLDEATFHKIIAAAYALQKSSLYSQRTEASNVQPVSLQTEPMLKIVPSANEIQVDVMAHPINLCPTPSEPLEIETALLESISGEPSHTRSAVAKPVPAANKSFWAVAAVAAVAAILSLSFLGVIHHSPPALAEVSRIPDAARPSAPLLRTGYLVNSPTSISAMHSGNNPNESLAPQKIMRAKAPRRLTTRKKMARRHLHHRTHSPKRDIIAKDTVIYYSAGPVNTASSHN